MSKSSNKKNKKTNKGPSDILIAKNKKAFHEYEILEKFEAGISLCGTEVRSLRDRNCQLTDTFIFIRKGQPWIQNLHISPYKYGSIFNLDPARRRRLLLHKKEIRKLEQKTSMKGYTIIPLKIYFKLGKLVKVQIALARGLKIYDKRQIIAKKTQKREAESYLKQKTYSV